MKAISKLKEKPGLWLIDTPEPELGDSDVMIKIRKTAICGTDIHIYNWDNWAKKTIPVPIIIGHEYMGEIIKIGQYVKNYKIGDRVSSDGHIVCLNCRNCKRGIFHLCRKTINVGINRPGCFAEYLVVPSFNVFKIPDFITDDIAAIFDPFGNAVHTALSFDLSGEDVLISGAGPIGIMSALVCHHVGARHVVITDINDYRLELAKKNGILKTVNVLYKNIFDVMDELGIKEGFGVGLEASGSDKAFQNMIDVISYGGKISLLGISKSPSTVDLNKIISKGVFIKGIYGRELFETWYKMTSLIQSGLNLSKIITHEFIVDDFQKGIDIMKNGLSGKVLLKWD
ncbi:L-threonine 3-dehydrogenase [Candidatus Providencia siddallii]|uniref:L-threonine 3-dehydrogenase n=1 Tax=Candidatus Providencia siddallii TaxID=1715285 RepID=A0ABM9NND8_9GAMM